MVHVCLDSSCNDDIQLNVGRTGEVVLDTSTTTRMAKIHILNGKLAIHYCRTEVMATNRRSHHVLGRDHSFREGVLLHHLDDTDLSVSRTYTPITATKFRSTRCILCHVTQTYHSICIESQRMQYELTTASPS